VMQDLQTDQTRVEVRVRFRSKRFCHGFLRRSDGSPPGCAEDLGADFRWDDRATDRVCTFPAQFWSRSQSS
jgi:hypothetical protein